MYVHYNALRNPIQQLLNASERDAWRTFTKQRNYDFKLKLTTNIYDMEFPCRPSVMEKLMSIFFLPTNITDGFLLSCPLPSRFVFGTWIDWEGGGKITYSAIHDTKTGKTFLLEEGEQFKNDIHEAFTLHGLVGVRDWYINFEGDDPEITDLDSDEWENLEHFYPRE